MTQKVIERFFKKEALCTVANYKYDWSESMTELLASWQSPNVIFSYSKQSIILTTVLQEMTT